MKPWSDTLVLSHPLADAWLAGQAPPEALERRAQAREREGYERGRREGERILGEQLVRQRAELIELQNGVLAALRQSLPQVVRECEQSVVELALAVAEKLVAGLPVSAEMVEAAVREALARLEDTGECTVRLHAEDFALLERVNSPLLLEAVGGGRMRFECSAEVSRGGCVVATRFGTVDARRETKLALLRDSLLNA